MNIILVKTLEQVSKGSRIPSAAAWTPKPNISTYEGVSESSRTKCVFKKQQHIHTLNIYSFSKYLPPTACTSPISPPTHGTRAAVRRVTSPAMSCLRLPVGPRETRIYLHVDSFSTRETARSHKLPGPAIGGCGSNSIPSFSIVSCTMRLVWDGALSWCKMKPDWINSGRFLLTVLYSSDLSSVA